MLGLAVTVGLLAWALRGVDLDAVLQHIQQARLGWLLAAVALATLTFPLRTARWAVILRDAGGRRLPLGPLWHATAIGFMANNLLPARAGEIARAYMAQRQLPVRFTTAVASIAVERVLDGLTLVGLMVLALAAPSFSAAGRVGGASLSRLAVGAALVFGGALVLALIVVHRPAPWLALLGRVFHWLLPARLADRLLHAAGGLVAGLEVLKAPRRLVEAVTWSLALWLVNAASFWICFRAFDLPVPAAGALVLQGLIAIGVAIPAAPGFFGVFEAVTREALALYGVGAEQAVGYAVAYHLATFVPITLLGLYSLSRGHVRLGELRATSAGTPAG